MGELDILKEYVKNSDSINDSLRKGIDIPEIKILDSLLVEGEVPRYLYRLLDNKDVKIAGNSSILDAGYLSCSSCFDDFIDNTGEVKHMACYRIEEASPISRIIVNELLPDQNDEGEIILPRNLPLQIIDNIDYSGVGDFERLLEEVKCDSTGPKELFYAMGIETITLYRLRVVRLNDNMFCTKCGTQKDR